MLPSSSCTRSRGTTIDSCRSELSREYSRCIRRCAAARAWDGVPRRNETIRARPCSSVPLWVAAHSCQSSPVASGVPVIVHDPASRSVRRAMPRF
ncbi:hypothetical protein ACFSUH_44010 [Rhodococcus jostii]|uniref:hypothetical protein n=1 Tax=Rhodococcus jostii TaxID=132919 RepID=UPI0036447FAC